MSEHNHEASEKPRLEKRRYISVVVPVYEQWDLVPTLIACLHKQTLSIDLFEIILVDNGSLKPNVPNRLPENVHVTSCAVPGSYAARNHGAAMAKGDWLAFTDADCQPHEGWLFSIYQAGPASDLDRTLLAGSVVLFSPRERPNIWEKYDIVRGIPQERYVSRGYAATANLALPKALFDELGGFEAARFSGGDAELCRRARAIGCDLIYCGRARVNHPARATWQEISIKARRIKGGQIRAGSLRRRVVWGLSTLAPPVRGVWRFLASPTHPTHYKLAAVLVLMRVWLVEVVELLRLCAGTRAERR
ncbi:glycosyltransferase [Nitratireductor aquibiodomus]|nr:glycosyltransferase [Nitratireductor aquibiodomus]MBN7762750.1 glycosyltransferase [Nitratireductor aquibiodomus]